MKLIVLGSLVLAIAPCAWAQSTSSDSGKGTAESAPQQVDRSQYNLFNPTPAANMRGFMPDRPNVTDGPFAIGLIPFLTFPSGADGVGGRGYAGGIGLPAQLNLPADFSLSAETTVQSVHEPGDGSHFDYLNSVSLGHPITKRLSTYVEFATDISTEPHTNWIGTVDTALIYQPGNNWEFDAGVNIGVTRAANDLFMFVGTAWRY